MDMILSVKEIARVCHNVNKAYCEAIGDDSQVNWEEAPEWQRNSAIAGVCLHAGDSDITPADSHVSWMKQKEADGWKYGEVKDADKKEHPCMVPYEELPVEQKAKDYIFKQIVDSLMELQST